MKLLTHEIPTPWGKIATVVDVTDVPTVVAAGFICPKTLYVVAIIFPYAPINMNG